MPKYYRFRPTSPTRKAKRYKNTEEVLGDIERIKSENEMKWMDFTLACMPLPNWYLRRTSWRLSPTLVGVPRQHVANITAPIQLGNRHFYVFKAAAPHTNPSAWPNFILRGN